MTMSSDIFGYSMSSVDHRLFGPIKKIIENIAPIYACLNIEYSDISVETTFKFKKNTH